MPRFSVIVADDHPLFREGVVRAVRGWPELELLAEVSNGREALEQIRALTPDVACVDLRLPDIDGIGIAKAVTRDGLTTRVLLLSADAEGLERARDVDGIGPVEPLDLTERVDLQNPGESRDQGNDEEQHLEHCAGS